jgi:DNA invertase Pin-like site-specific DNA recombinase
MIFGILAVMAEFEREMIGTYLAGMAAAKRRGRHVGRPRKLTDHRLDRARQLIADGTENGPVPLPCSVSTSRRCGGR